MPFSIQNTRSSGWRMPSTGLFLKTPWNPCLPKQAVRPIPSGPSHPGDGGWLDVKRLDHLGDETLMDRWIENPYRPYFTGFDVMNHQPPGDSSDGRPMRDRMGPAGMEKIFAYSVSLHQKEIKKSSMV